MDKKILVTKSFLPPFEEYAEEIRGLWDTHWITNMGEEHEKLETALKEYLGADHICLFQNGHLALELSLQALGLKGEIITTPFTFASTTWAILRAGCIPVFCDVLPGTCTLDPDKIEALITERTSAILPVHVYGNLCEVDAIQEIADRHGLKVIYDAAHAFGVTRNGLLRRSFHVQLPCHQGVPHHRRRLCMLPGSVSPGSAVPDQEFRDPGKRDLGNRREREDE